MKISKSLINIIRKNGSFPFLLFFLHLLVYGIFIPFLGFYWDDFPYIWFRYMDGPAGVIRAIGLDRPVLGLFYALPMSILGLYTAGWQVFAILSRWVFSLSVYSFLTQLWPTQKKSNQLITLLISVFPGFTQQWISVIFSHAFLIFALYFFSLKLFIKNIRKEKPALLQTIIAVGISVLCMAGTEYLVGLEVLRPLIIYKIIDENNKTKDLREKFRRVILLWSPYLAAAMSFIFYRLFLASSVLYKPANAEGLIIEPISSINYLLTRQIKNFFISTVAAWGSIFKPLGNLVMSSLISKLYLFFLGVFFVAAFVLVLKHYSSVVEDTKKSWKIQYYIGSAVSLFFVGIPFWAAGLQPGAHFPADRFLLPFMLGSAILLFIVLLALCKNKYMFSIFFSLILALSASFQFYQANEFRNEWDDLKAFFQQFAWRVPSIEENTIFITDELPLIYYSDNSLTAPLNWIYSEKSSVNEIPYMFNYTSARLGKSLRSLDPGTPIIHNYRTYTFSGSTDRMIIFYHQPPGCLHIADPELDVENPLIPVEIRSAIPRSNTDLISMVQTRDTPFFLDDSPKETWCYYFQKASLSAQYKNWEEVARLGDTAFALDDYPNDASERMPFIEGYAFNNELDKALALSRITHEISGLYDPMICRLWELIIEKLPGDKDISIVYSEINQIANCEP